MRAINRKALNIPCRVACLQSRFISKRYARAARRQRHLARPLEIVWGVAPSTTTTARPLIAMYWELCSVHDRFCPALSFTTKAAPMSSTDHGGVKRRAFIVGSCHVGPARRELFDHLAT